MRYSLSALSRSGGTLFLVKGMQYMSAHLMRGHARWGYSSVRARNARSPSSTRPRAKSDTASPVIMLVSVSSPVSGNSRQKSRQNAILPSWRDGSSRPAFPRCVSMSWHHSQRWKSPRSSLPTSSIERISGVNHPFTPSHAWSQSLQPSTPLPLSTW